MNGFKTVATVACMGDLNGKSMAEAADATRAKLVDQLDGWERLGYHRDGNITLVYKAITLGMRWVASVKMSKEG
jgi:hypothetical protein